MKTSLIFLFASLGQCDIYMQSPPGSNNRLDEQNRERDNANRLMDTQNNNRGGYNVGKMGYYHGEEVPIAWSNQHGSSKYQMENSEFVVQYMCSPLLRDGTTTRTIPVKATECQNFDCDTDVRFGRMESVDSYEMCKKTSRNKGLFTANQNLQGNDASKTRQNPQGTRSGLECPEERDHYPYWRPTDWVDMYYVTADTEKCEKIVAESQNVKSRFECRMPDAYFDAGGELNNNFLYPITEAECAETTLTSPAPDAVTYTAEWNEIPAHGVAAPLCQQIEQTRANHHGNAGGKGLYELPWKVPDDIPDGSQCAVRIRYNITTAEYAAWESSESLNAGADVTQSSEKNNPNPNNDPAEVQIWTDYGLDRAAVQASFTGNDDDSREYVLENNPRVDAFGVEYGDTGQNNGRIKLQLAVNTAQFGRTFQDRTHQFIVNKRPDEVPATATMKLLTVRGKRGNIVQVYPATEYIYHPEKFYIKQDEYVHIEWTGSNTNPNNNDGQGRQGTDRSNMVCQRREQYSTELYSNFERFMTYEDGKIDKTSAGTSYPAFVKQPDGYIIPDELQEEVVTGCLGGMSEDVLKQLATIRQTPHDQGNMEELDDAGTSMNLAPQKVSELGCWSYLGTRNNNFSNRAQKGLFCVSEGTVGDVLVGTAGVEWSDLNAASAIMVWPNSVAGQQAAHVTVQQTSDGTSEVVAVSGFELHDEGKMTVSVGYSPKALYTSQMVWQAPCDSESAKPGEKCDNPWKEIPYTATTNENGNYVAMADVGNVGSFKVISKPNAAPIFAMFVATCGFCLALSYVLYKRCGDKLPEGLRNRLPGKPGSANKSVSTTQMGSVQATNTNAPPPPARGF